eukprot:13850263-Alexandrium_andersonii.AAC.1
MQTWRPSRARGLPAASARRSWAGCPPPAGAAVLRLHCPSWADPGGGCARAAGRPGCRASERQ